MKINFLEILSVISYFLILLGTTTSDSKEATLNSVHITIYEVTMNQWTSELKSSFNSFLIKDAEQFCSSNLDRCKLPSSTSSNDLKFQENDIVITPGYPKYTAPELEHNFSLKISSLSSTKIIPRDALIEIVKIVYKSLADKNKKYITNINDEQMKLQPDMMLNLIICAITVGFTILLTIIMCIMKSCCGKQDYNNTKYHSKMNGAKSTDNMSKATTETDLNTLEMNTLNCHAEKSNNTSPPLPISKSINVHPIERYHTLEGDILDQYPTNSNNK